MAAPPPNASYRFSEVVHRLGREIRAPAPAGEQLRRTYTGVIADAPPSDGLLASWLEPSVRQANEEPPPVTDLGVMRGEAAVEPASSKIARGVADAPGSAGLMVPKFQPPVHAADRTPPPPPVLRLVSISP
jgi:hypothetical protein